jgi:hypothetical protein
VRAGHVYEQTDESGVNVVADAVPVHDLHATLLHLLSLDHTQLTFRFQDRDYRLTDVQGNVVKGLLASAVRGGAASFAGDPRDAESVRHPRATLPMCARRTKWRG